MVFVPTASKPATTRDRSSGKKRKAATQVKEQPRNVKAKSSHKSWTAEEDAALVEAVKEYGLDWGCIKAEARAHLGGRKVTALYDHFRKYHPETYRELREANPVTNPSGPLWTAEEDEALKWERLNTTTTGRRSTILRRKFLVVERWVRLEAGLAT